MKLTARDKQLVIWLPALATVIGYFWLAASAPHARIKRLERQISQAIEKAPTPLDLAETQARIVQLNRDLAAGETTAEKMKATLSTQIGGSTNSIANNAAEQIAALFSQHHLVLVEQVPATIPPGAVSPALQHLAEQSAKTLGAGGATFWQIKLAGNYLDMTRALNDLAGSDVRAVIASLNMADGPQPATKLWTLVLWM